MKAYYVSNNEEILYVCISAELAESKKERELEDNDNDCEIEEVNVTVRSKFADLPTSNSFIYWVIPEITEYPEESKIEFTSLSEEDAEDMARKLSISDDCQYTVSRVEVLRY